MKKFIFLATLMLLFSSVLLTAQVTVGSDTKPKATLDVIGAPGDDIPAGVIAPRVTVEQLNTNAAKYTSDLTGAIVYVTNVAGASATTKTGNISAVGYYYFDGAAWQVLGGGTERLKIKEITAEYTITEDDEDWLIITRGTSAITVNFPTDWDESKKGFRVFVFNGNSAGANNYKPAEIFWGSPGFATNGGAWVVWTGSRWLSLSKA